MSTARLALFLLTHLVWSMVLFTSLTAALVFLVRAPMRKYKPLDLAVFERLRKFPNARRNRFMLFMTWLGKPEFLIPANLVPIVYFLLIPRKSWVSIRVLAIALSSLVLMFVLKALFRRKRPLSPLLQAARGLSFPSGHAIMSVSFFGGLIAWTIHSDLTAETKIMLVIALVVIILLVGFSRVYLRVHYASDVIAGWVIGLIWLLIALTVVGNAEQISRSA